MKILFNFLMSVIVLSSIDAKAFEAENAVSEMDSRDENYKRFFWHTDILPELNEVISDSITMGCDHENDPITTEAAMEDFDTCIEPSITELSRINSLEIEDIWMSMRTFSLLSEKSLSFLRRNLLGPFCYHIPILLNCYMNHFESHLQTCRPEIVPTLKYFQKLLPSICVYNGTRLEGIVDVKSQHCIRSYLLEFVNCSYNSHLLNNNVDDMQCMTLNCMIFNGKQVPCKMSKESEISLHFLLEHIHDMRGCKTTAMANSINTIHRNACDFAQIPYEPTNFASPLRTCIEPFLAFTNFLEHVTNSTLERTKYIHKLSMDVTAFTKKINDICDQVVNNQSCVTAIKDVVGTCYRDQNQHWNSFLTYFDTFLQSECQNNGARITEFFKVGDMKCLVSQLSSAWTCFDKIKPDPKAESIGDHDGLCENLAVLHSCSLQNLNKCFKKDSFRNMNKTLTEMHQRIDVLCQQHQRAVGDKLPVLNAQHMSHTTVAIIVIPIAAALGFILLHFMVSQKRSRIRGP